jgi:regulator of protease activity HflC (stomatin/prohibitin superfamily)
MELQAPESNAYLGEVLQQQQRVDFELKRKVRAPGPAPAPARAAEAAPEGARAGASGETRGTDFRITGWWRWKTVVVPPNVYVVHTRRGEDQPLHIGMGESFRYNPFTDAFLVIPAVMQTIVISARCICAERQGILVQAYVQWIIDDIAKAYKKLDFSDAEDRMGIVNVQLREQAEAAIKDKVATLRIDEILADKQPIIEELTLRLRAVAEGSREEGTGLGLKIVTVQIKEAVVSSTRLWENLQKPFRVERERLARIAEIETEQQVAARQLEIRQAREAAEIAAQSELQKHRAVVERVAFDRTQQEQLRRGAAEQEAARRITADQNATEIARREGELELVLKSLEVMRQRVDAEVETLAQQRKLDVAEAARARGQAEETLARDELRSKAQALIADREVAQFRAHRQVENELSEGLVKSQLVAALPEIASRLPTPKQLKSVTISGDGAAGGTAALTGLLSSLLAVVEERSPKK